MRDVYTWAHTPLVAGIILSAAALEEITLHPADDVELAFRTMLFGGLALGVVGIGAAISRAFHAVVRERIVAVTVIAVVLLIGGSIDGVVLLIAVDLIIAATLAVEHSRIER